MQTASVGAEAVTPRSPFRTTVATVVAGLLIVGAGFASVYTIIRAGHQGASVTWSDVKQGDG